MIHEDMNYALILCFSSSLPSHIPFQFACAVLILLRIPSISNRLESIDVHGEIYGIFLMKPDDTTTNWVNMANNRQKSQLSHGTCIYEFNYYFYVNVRRGISGGNEILFSLLRAVLQINIFAWYCLSCAKLACMKTITIIIKWWGTKVQREGRVCIICGTRLLGGNIRGMKIQCAGLWLGVGPVIFHLPASINVFAAICQQ